ncbi:hypothetical protein AMEX_G2468 [Astyanax mexicanus]|uniref:Uncharacterized protein n=1 Tax=Astyanax mexicanus TaxID=7994 RepID=A0A8T2MPF7_ASTMX|nr:hypothetical protein AMEX_G2468 [Astyanax mexicanus]
MWTRKLQEEKRNPKLQCCSVIAEAQEVTCKQAELSFFLTGLRGGHGVPVDHIWDNTHWCIHAPSAPLSDLIKRVCNSCTRR